MDTHSDSLEKWFSERPQWLQAAVSVLNSGSAISIEQLLELCINESKGEAL